MVFQPIDIALLLISFAACVYCILLSRRLAALQNTKDGLGATIAACTESISSMSLATRSTTAQAKELAAELSGLLSQAEEVCHKVESLTIKMDTKQKQTASKIHYAQNELDVVMRRVLEQHKKQVAEIVALTKQARPVINHANGSLKGSHQAKFTSLLETNKQRSTLP